MKPAIQKLWMFIVVLCTFIPASAYDFEVDGIAYTITSITDLTVGVAQLVENDVSEITIPETVEYRNRSLKVTSIMNDAFKADGRESKLTKVSMPNTIVSIGEGAFRWNTSLTEVNIPFGVKEIEDYVFFCCSSLRDVVLHSDIRSIGSYAFDGTGISSITLPSNLVSLGSYAFYNTQLRDIHIPAKVEVIEGGCFSNCTELRYVTFEQDPISSLTRIESTALSNCGAFSDCPNLTEFSIPSGVNFIAPSILWGCPNLSKLTIGKGLKGLPATIDRYNRASTLGSYHTKSQLTGIKEFIIEDSNDDFSIKGFRTTNGWIAPFSNTELDYYYVGRPLIDVTTFYYTGNYYKEDINTSMGTGRIKKLEIGGSCTSVPKFYQKIDTLKLGANIKSFNLSNIYTKDIRKIECLAKNPPICENEFPNKVYTDAVLYVPAGCKEAYAKADIWKNFWDIYEIGSDNDGVSDILNDEINDLYNVYNIAGILIGKSYDIEKIKNLPKGFYIITNKSKRYKIKV